jgi:hypothetical protein
MQNFEQIGKYGVLKIVCGNRKIVLSIWAKSSAKRPGDLLHLDQKKMVWFCNFFAVD